METPHPLRTWRKSQEKPLNQAAVGDLVGIGASQVSQIESGLRGCSLDTAIKIHKVTGGAVPLESLLQGQQQAAE